MKKLILMLILLFSLGSLTACENLGALNDLLGSNPILGDKDEDEDDDEDESDDESDDDLEDSSESEEEESKNEGDSPLLPMLTEKEVIEKVMDSISIPELRGPISYLLPKNNDYLEGLTFTYSLTENPYVVLDENELFINEAYEKKDIVLTVTVSYHDIEVTKDFPINVTVTESYTLKEFLEQAPGVMYLIEGTVVSLHGLGDKTNFSISDGTATVYVYNRNYDFKIGDYVKLAASHTNYRDNQEIMDLKVLECRPGEGNLDELYAKAEEIDLATLHKDYETLDVLSLIKKYNYRLLKVEGYLYGKFLNTIDNKYANNFFPVYYEGFEKFLGKHVTVYFNICTITGLPDKLPVLRTGISKIEDLGTHSVSNKYISDLSVNEIIKITGTVTNANLDFAVIDDFTGQVCTEFDNLREGCTYTLIGRLTEEFDKKYFETFAAVLISEGVPQDESYSALSGVNISDFNFTNFSKVEISGRFINDLNVFTVDGIANVYIHNLDNSLEFALQNQIGNLVMLRGIIIQNLTYNMTFLVVISCSY